MNDLTILVTKYLSINNLSRNQLAQLLGYSNVSKGLRNLDQYCSILIDKNQISTKLPIVLNIPQLEYSKAVNQVQSDLENKERSKFKPSLQVVPKSRPSPIFAVAMFPRLLNIEIPDLNGCSYAQEIKLIINEYNNHQQIYSNGKGFRYFRNYDETLIFNEQGEIIDHIKKHIEPIKATLLIKGKNLQPIIGK